MRFLVLFYSLITFLAGCQQVVSLSEPRVIEQSRQERPAWVATAAGRLPGTGALVEYHSIKSKVMDLPLGLRQAEAVAVNESKYFIEQELLAVWKKDKLFQNLAMVDQLALAQRLQQLLDAQVNGDLIHDIYFEKVLDPSEVMALQETYAVHVQLQLAQTQLQSILQDLRAYCQNSVRDGLVQLSRNQQVFSAQL